MESECVSQAFSCDTRTEIATVNLEENCKCKGGGRVGRGPGHRSRSPKARYERGAQGIAVRVVEEMWCSVAIRARLSKRKGKEQFSYPTTTTRHRRIPEECGSLLRQRPNTKSWSAIVQRTELTKRTSSSKQNFQVSNQNAHFSEPYNSGTAGQ